MQCTVTNADFSRELRLLEKVVGKKPAISILGNVLIQVHEGALIMSATDLEVGLVGACMAHVAESGALTLPAKRLSDVVKAQSSPEIELEADAAKGVVKVSAGKFRSRLQSLPPADFPAIAAMEGDVVELPREDLKRMIPQVRYAVDAANTRYFLNGAFMSLGEGDMTLAAMDGPRLSITRASRTGDATDPVLIPSKALDQLSALLAEAPERDTVQFSRTERHLFFDVDGRLMLSRQIDGKFPDYMRVVRQAASNTAARVDREILVAVLNRLNLIDKVVTFEVTKGAMHLSTTGQGVGDGAEDLFVEYDGPTVKQVYDCTYILDFLTRATGEHVDLCFGEQTKGADGKAVYPPLLLQDGDFQNIVMGIKR